MIWLRCGGCPDAPADPLAAIEEAPHHRAMQDESIFHEAWLPNIVAEANLIANHEDVLRRAWLSAIPGETSVINPHELIDQTLDSGFEGGWPDVARYLPAPIPLVAALENFRRGLEGLHVFLKEGNTAEELLASDCWVTLKEAASAVVIEAGKAGYAGDQ